MLYDETREEDMQSTRAFQTSRSTARLNQLCYYTDR